MPLLEPLLRPGSFLRRISLRELQQHLQEGRHIPTSPSVNRCCPSRYGRVHRGLLRPRSCVFLFFFLRNYEAGRDNSRLYAPCLSLCSSFTSAGHTANLVSPSTVRRGRFNPTLSHTKTTGGLMLCTAL